MKMGFQAAIPTREFSKKLEKFWGKSAFGSIVSESPQVTEELLQEFYGSDGLPITSKRETWGGK